MTWLHDVDNAINFKLFILHFFTQEVIPIITCTPQAFVASSLMIEHYMGLGYDQRANYSANWLMFIKRIVDLLNAGCDLSAYG